MSQIIVCGSKQVELQGVPSIVRLIPLGQVKSTKGDFNVDEESFQLIRENFLARGNDLVIDYEHQTLHDVQAPAGGWIKDLTLEDDAICGVVDWTSKAEEYLKNREYRYLSPVVVVRKSDRKAIALHSAALTNTPAIDGMFTIINSQSITDYEEGENNMELLKQLAALLGLGEDATEDQIFEALKTCVKELQQLKDASVPPAEGDEDKIVANKLVCELLGLKAGAATADVTAAIMSLKQTSDSDQVSTTEFKALKDKLERREADDAVTVALKQGKIAPAQKEWATTYALKDPSGFASFVEKAPQVIPLKEILNEDAPPAPVGYDDATLQICKDLGLSKEDLDKFGKDGK